MEDLDFGPEASRIIQALITASPAPPAIVPDESLVRFALGWCGEEEADAVIGALTENEGLRTRLLALRREIKAGNPKDPALARFLDEYLPRAIARFRTDRGDWRAGGPISDGIWAAIGRRLVASPPPAAIFRGEERHRIQGMERTTARLRAAVEADGNLVISVEIEPPNAHPLTLSLALEDPVLGTLPIDRITVTEGRGSFRLAAGERLSLPRGGVPSDRFVLSAFENDERPTDHWAINLTGSDGSETFLRVPFSGMPYVEDGRLVVPLALSRSVANPLIGYDLYADLLLAPRPLPLGRVDLASVMAAGYAQFRLAAQPGPLPPQALALRLVPSDRFRA